MTGWWTGILQRKSLAVGLALTVVFITVSLLAGVLSPYPPDATNYDLRFATPSFAHPMGTDEHGRDLLSRVLHGGQVSLLISFAAVALSSVIGIPLGLAVGYFGGLADNVTGRIVDALFAFPSILWAIALAAIMGPSMHAAILALGIARIPVTTRLARSAVISVKQNEYVAASQILGSSTPFILFRSILPNCAGPLVVLVSLGLAVTILSEAGLSYLGLSVQPPTPSWGNLIQESQRYLAESPWFAFFPGITLFVVVLGINLLGDGIRDVFDPHGRRRN